MRAEINLSLDVDQAGLPDVFSNTSAGSIVATTLQHELVHVVIHTLGRRKTPRWFAEASRFMSPVKEK